MDDVLDLLIVGAGLYGISAANTYLAIHPEASLRVLESGPDVGGVWSKSRTYPKFWSQTGKRLCGFPDKPFECPTNAYDLFEAKYLSQYLEDYIGENTHNGLPLMERFVFNCAVQIISKSDDIWCIESSKDNKPITHRARKVIVSTGLSTIPVMPTFSAQDKFKGPILHQKDFGRSNILTDAEPDIDNHEHITILGGSKSAADIVYAAATDASRNRGRKVTWIIKRTGSGPLILIPPKGFGKYRGLPETGSTRAMGKLSSADPWAQSDTWWAWFCQATALGNAFLEAIWNRAGADSYTLANFKGRDGALPGFEELAGKSDMRWRKGHVGILQHDNYWDVVAKTVQVYRQDIDHLEEDAVVLENGTRVRSDVLLCGTGWKNGQHPYFTPQEASRLGLPLPLTEEVLVQEEKQHWQAIDKAADAQIVSRWPYLADKPAKHPPNEAPNTTAYRLYKLTTPINDQSIAFLGTPLVPNSYHTSLAQTLFAIAVLDGKYKLPSVEEMERDIAFINSWNRHRYPAHGYLGNVVEYEMVSFTDELLHQLGLSSHRKQGRQDDGWLARFWTWWADMTDPCLASDYAGLVDEYKAKYMGD